MSTQQPPRTERERYDEVTGTLGSATDQVAATRIAVVDADLPQVAVLFGQLDRTLEELADLESALSQPPGSP